MAKLIYSAITSLDGYVADEEENFDWAAPDEEVHSFVNELERPVGTYFYGRRMYEVMAYWETAAEAVDLPPFVQDFAEIWNAADKIVYSRTLERFPVRGRGSSDTSTQKRSGSYKRQRGECRFGKGVVYLHYRMSTSSRRAAPGRATDV
jgi:dihydrofolate reductase